MNDLPSLGVGEPVQLQALVVGFLMTVSRADAKGYPPGIRFKPVVQCANGVHKLESSSKASLCCSYT